MNLIRKITLENANHPEILYWFWDEDTLKNEKYLQDIKRIKEESPFDLIFLTARGNLNFYADKDQLFPAFAKTVEYAHQNSIKIGLQLWRQHENLTQDNALALIVEGEKTLNWRGSTQYRAIKKGDRNAEPLESVLFAAYVFDKIENGVYNKQSFEEITEKCDVSVIDAETLDIHVELGEQYADKTVYFLTAHYCKSPDLYSDYYIEEYERILQHYDAIPFDGIGLDEFKSMNIIHDVDVFKKNQKFRERLYGHSFAKLFKDKTDIELKQAILEMRYISQGEESMRMRAINYYFDVLKENVIRIENFVAQKAKQIYGDDVFIGLHNTYHNFIGKDEIWQTGCMWWDLPREYGQTDENISYPVRLGIGCSYPKSIVYDMYYQRKSPERIYEKAMMDARYNCRIHYHAYNDCRPHRYNINNNEFLQNITKIEEKIRMLNHIDTPLPQMDLLVVFGRPSLTNWYPHEEYRDDYDMNLRLRVIEKCDILWNNGIVCALVPSTKIDSGVLRIDDDGRINYNGHIFKQLLFIGPEYSKVSTLSFLLQCAQNNLTFIDGKATHDFDGKDCSEMFGRISNYAHVFDFSLPQMLKLGLKKNAIKNGCILEDDTVILSNLDSILTDVSEKFSICIGNYTFTGFYTGIVALRADVVSGEVERFICGGFQELYCNGKKILETKSKCDIIYDKYQNHIQLIGNNSENNTYFVKETLI